MKLMLLNEEEVQIRDQTVLSVWYVLRIEEVLGRRSMEIPKYPTPFNSMDFWQNN